MALQKGLRGVANHQQMENYVARIAAAALPDSLVQIVLWHSIAMPVAFQQQKENDPPALSPMPS